jgi:uncharacterized protein (DUF885 family)
MPLLASLLLAAAVLATGGAPAAESAPAPSPEDVRFARVVEETLEAHWKLDPEGAFAAGYYRHADTLAVPDGASRAAQVAFIDRTLTALAGFDLSRLSLSNRVDLALLQNWLEASRWNIETFRAWEWQPSAYNVADGFARQLDTPYAPLEKRLRDMLARLARVPAYYAAARASLGTPTLEHTRLAILQNRGALEVFGDPLLAKVDGSALDAAEKALFRERVSSARKAIEEYLAFLGELEGRLAKGGARSFRIGKELHAAKFTHDIQSSFTADELHRMALAEKASLHDRMELLARVLWPRYMGKRPIPEDRLELIGAVIDELGKHHVAPDQFLPEIRRQIPVLEAFVRTHDLLDQDPTRPLEVRETPPYLRGVAGAGINSPGPYDPGARTYYDVTPLEGGSSQSAESFLREYNDWTLQILNIHEAVPGHYLQQVHANRSPSMVRTLFGSGAMVEGWAVYGERMMLDAGYGDNAPEMWLLWMKWNLRAVVNAILDREVHAGDMDEARALDLLRRQAFQTEAEATEKWRRATLTQVQLMSYYDGYAEILALRAEEKARLGKDFRLKDFHNRLLSYGNAPVRVIRQLMRE